MTRRDRLWFPVEVHYWDCPEVIAMGDNAAILFQEMLGYARKFPRLGGLLPAESLESMRHREHLAPLLAHEWVRLEPDGRLMLMDWLKWNPITAALDAKRENDRERQRANRSHLLLEEGQHQVLRERERDVAATVTQVVARQSRDSSATDAFSQFWGMYPRKVGKRAALAAYIKAASRASHQDIINGLQMQLPHWTDPRYIPHPTTWLNRDGWEDQPAPPTGAIAAVTDLAQQAARLEAGRKFF